MNTFIYEITLYTELSSLNINEYINMSVACSKPDRDKKTLTKHVLQQHCVYVHMSKLHISEMLQWANVRNIPSSCCTLFKNNNKDWQPIRNNVNHKSGKCPYFAVRDTNNDFCYPKQTYYVSVYKRSCNQSCDYLMLVHKFLLVVEFPDNMKHIMHSVYKCSVGTNINIVIYVFWGKLFLQNWIYLK